MRQAGRGHIEVVHGPADAASGRTARAARCGKGHVEVVRGPMGYSARVARQLEHRHAVWYRYWYADIDSIEIQGSGFVPGLSGLTEVAAPPER